MAKRERRSRPTAAPNCNNRVFDMCDSLRYSLLTVLASDPVAADRLRRQAGLRSAEFKCASYTQNIRYSGVYVKMSRPVVVGKGKVSLAEHEPGRKRLLSVSASVRYRWLR